MASPPNPNSPYLASRLQATMGVRDPGTPSMAGKPGVQPGNYSYPAPPQPAMGIPGRPPTVKPQIPVPSVPSVPVPQTDGGTVGATSGADVHSMPQGSAIAPPMDPAVLYQQAVVKGRQALGALPSVFRHPNLPTIPFEPGVHNYNPFMGAWVGPDGQ